MELPSGSALTKEATRAMECDDVRRQLTGYLDGELDAERGTVIRGHLRTCAGCRRVADDEAVVRDGLRGLPSADPPASLWAGVQARLAAEEVRHAQQPGWRRAFARWGQVTRRWVPSPSRLVVGGAAAAAFAGVVWWKLQADPGPRVVELPSPTFAATSTTPPVAQRDVIAPDPTTDDVSTALEREPARIAASYQRTIDELLAVAADMRNEWSDARRVAFDQQIAALRTALGRAEEGKPKRRASRALIRYLEGAVIRDELAMAGGRL